MYAEAHAFLGKDGPDPETTALYAPLGEAVFAQGVAAQFASGQYGANVRVWKKDWRCPNFRRPPAPRRRQLKSSPGSTPTPNREGVAVLTKGLSLDAWCYAHQLGDATIVLN